MTLELVEYLLNHCGISKEYGAITIESRGNSRPGIGLEGQGTSSIQQIGVSLVCRFCANLYERQNCNIIGSNVLYLKCIEPQRLLLKVVEHHRLSWNVVDHHGMAFYGMRRHCQ